MSWQTVNIEQVYYIHQAMIKKAGTKASIRDFALLHSAVERPKATFDGKELYPSIFLKAASLLQSLCLNHPFTDGNKRTAWLATKRLLKINGYHLKAKKMEAADFMVEVDNVLPQRDPESGGKKPDITRISKWLKNHSIKI